MSDTGSLTVQQCTDIRRYMGYSVSGNSTYQTFREQVYSNATAYGSLSLDTRLANLTTEEVTTVTTYYLANLYLREADIQTSAGNLDTERAAVWYHNKNEVADRRELYNTLRRELCDFLGFPYGRGLTTNRVMRA